MEKVNCKILNGCPNVILKLKTVTVIGCFLFANCIYGQINPYLINMASGQDYHTISDSTERYLDTLFLNIDSSAYYSGGGEFKEYLKFKKMWEPRISQHGDFTKFIDAEYNYFNNLQANYSYLIRDQWQE